MGDDAVRRLARRGYSLDLSTLEALVSRRTASITSANQLRAESNQVTEQVQHAARAGEDVSELKERARELKEQIRAAEAEYDRAAAELQDLLLGIPNLPLDEVPDGDSEDFAVEIRRHGNPPSFAFEPKDHVDIGEGMGILDFGRAAKLSGPRFSVARGAGAALERGLAAFFLDLHTQQHGYLEYSLPNLVTRETMTGTGQLPKFEADLFKTAVGSRDLFLIPTAEVPLPREHPHPRRGSQDMLRRHTQRLRPADRPHHGSHPGDQPAAGRFRDHAGHAGALRGLQSHQPRRSAADVMLVGVCDLPIHATAEHDYWSLTTRMELPWPEICQILDNEALRVPRGA